jgi:hypothetical protein
MTTQVLKEYIDLVLELHTDEKYVASLGLGTKSVGKSSIEYALRSWFDFTQVELGRKLTRRERARARRIAASQWPIALQKYNGNIMLAKNDLYNSLDTMIMNTTPHIYRTTDEDI